jgi:ammonium transporter, Amt family
MPKIDTGDTAWLIVSSALVLLMTPALALFYGGMVRRKNVLSTLMYSFAAIPILSVAWALFGYSLAFGPTRHGLIGSLAYAGLNGLSAEVHGTVPTLAFVAFQMMFAVITPALISGAFAERMKFSAYIAFILLWSTLVYDPVAHWVWADGGWLYKLGALDFAGGTVVHLTAGMSALVCALVIGKRAGYPRHRALPHDLTMTLAGAGLLWFGWFGFNAGSALASGQLAALAFMATHLGAAGGALGWLFIEWKHRGKPTALGVASGLVAGLVAITPASGYVAPWAAIVIGFTAGVVCYGAVLLKNRFGYDDSLDAFGVHGVGGLAGALLTGVFAQKVLNDAGADGALFGNVRQLGVQALACAATGAYSVVLTFGILKLIDATIGLRVPESEEREGLDATQHGEEAYGESGGTADVMQSATAGERRHVVAAGEAAAE